MTYPTHPIQTGTQDYSAAVLALPDDQTVDVKEYAAGIAILIFICALAEPLILAHANGFISAGLILPAPDTSRPQAMRMISELCGPYQQYGNADRGARRLSECKAGSARGYRVLGRQSHRPLRSRRRGREGAQPVAGAGGHLGRGLLDSFAILG
jgi:hypothetical protein